MTRISQPAACKWSSSRSCQGPRSAEANVKRRIHGSEACNPRRAPNLHGHSVDDLPVVESLSGLPDVLQRDAFSRKTAQKYGLTLMSR